jgi:hypothetical protein
MVVRLYGQDHASCCNKKRLGVAEANVTYKRMLRHLYGSSSPRRACIQHVQKQQHVATAAWLYEVRAAGNISDQTPASLKTCFTSNNSFDAERSRGWALCQCRDRTQVRNRRLGYKIRRDSNRHASEAPTAGPCAPTSYGFSFESSVYQLPSDVRVPPQLPMAPVTYCSSVHVCPMYSDAIQIVLPSVTAAP